MTKKTFLALALVMLPWSAFSKGRVPEPQVPAYFVDNTEQFQFRAFEDDHGGFYLVWTDSGAASTSLRAQHFDPEGQALWTSSGIMVTSQLALVEDWNGLADGQGGLTLFWDEADGLHAQRFQMDGSRRFPGNSVRMSSSTAVHPHAIPDASGGTIVTWSQKLPENDRHVVMAQRFKDGKAQWGPGGFRVSRRPSHQTHPHLVYDNMSGAIVAWRDELNKVSEMRVQRLDTAGSRLWGEEGLKVYTPMGVTERPMIAALGSGDAAVAWVDYISGIRQIFLQRVGPQPELSWDINGATSTIRLFHRWNPLLYSDGKGGTWIAWEDYHDERHWQVQVDHLNEAGKSVWPQQEVTAAPAAGDQGFKAITGDGKDGIWLAWIDNRGASVSLYLQRLSKEGRVLLGESGLKIASNLNSPVNPILIPGPDDHVTLVWADRTAKKEWKLYWYNLTPNASPKP